MEKIWGNDMLFNYSDISDIFERCLFNFFMKAKEFEWVYSLYTSTILSDSKMLLEHRFLSLIQALESYHRIAYKGRYLEKKDYQKIKEKLLSDLESFSGEVKDNLTTVINFGNRYSLKSRLNEIYDDYFEIIDLFIEDKDNFISDVRKTRNFYTHVDKNSKENIETDDLFNMTNQIKLILEVCFLAEMDVPLNRIKEIMERNNEYKHLKALFNK